MSILTRLKLNSANARGFVFFLFLTTGVATIIKLSKDYEVSRSLRIEVTNLPLDKSISAIQPVNLEVEAKISGFALLRNTFNGKILEIPYEELENVASGTFTFSVFDHRTILQRSLANNANIVGFKPKVIKVLLDSLASKRVAVIPQTKISYATGYSADNEIEVVPDSITIVGPSDVLFQINSLNTSEVITSNVNQDINISTTIATDSIGDALRLSQNTIHLKQQVSRFTEGTVTVPITILNDPKEELKILPKTVQVLYNVALDDFDKIGASDFLVTCDYNAISSSQDFLALKIERSPSVVRRERLSTKQVKYIIINDSND